MKWRREVNYHGSRGYGSENAPVGQLSLTIAWLVEMAKIKLRTLRGRPNSPQVLLNEGQRKFSLLGTSSRAAPAECAFPLKPQIREHDWRILP